MWGGIECTVNRVENRYFDQLERNGHADRPDDLDRFAALGLRALRYPILWERTAPHGLAKANWRWADQRLKRLKKLGIRPIIGLVHHGSGPVSTSLLDPAFPQKLAEYAAAVATRYPWLEDYTPINEPLTTARFSGLYGCWYPHHASDAAFARTLVNQCRAVALAMAAIRAVNPAARLIQTEDLGKTFSTPALAYQADFDNHRRWLAFDLLFGRVTPDHPLWHYLLSAQIAEDELHWFLDHPCPPDIIGANYYPTSERFLDEHLDCYPAERHVGNHKQAYVDLEAVRVRAQGLAGPAALLRELWQTYQRPLAITEAHLNCTRDEQLRWLTELWQAAHTLRHEGIDLRAVTAWSLLGAYDWNTLLTRCEGHYEPGVFDLRAPQPRPTALATLLTDLAAGRPPNHPVLDTPGWWRRPKRLLYQPVDDNGTVAASVETPLPPHPSPRPLLILGGNGTLAYAFSRLCDHRGLLAHNLARPQLDITDATAVEAALHQFHPWAVINAAGYGRVDQAEREPDSCYHVNTNGPAVLAAACATHHIPFVTFSSDLVFDGQQAAPYVESDPVRPLNVYGRSKAQAEQRVLDLHPTALIVRTSAFFGPWDHHNFLTVALRALAGGQSIPAAADTYLSPTYVPDLVHATLDLLIDGEQGIWHLANEGTITWATLARRAARTAGYDANAVVSRPTRALGHTAPRPVYSVLGSERGRLLPPLDRALDCYFHDANQIWSHPIN
jgi:dTDP-4-dehydrorhamnose reductase